MPRESNLNRRTTGSFVIHAVVYLQRVLGDRWVDEHHHNEKDQERLRGNTSLQGRLGSRFDPGMDGDGCGLGPALGRLVPSSFVGRQAAGHYWQPSGDR